MKPVVLLLPLILSGCTGLTVKEIREQQAVWSESSAHDVEAVTSCLTEHPEFERFSQDRMRVLTYPGGKRVDVSFGAMQFFDFKNYYLISIKKVEDGKTAVELRRSEWDFGPMNQESLVKNIGECL